MPKHARLHALLVALAAALAVPAGAQALAPGATALVDRPSGFGALPGDGDNQTYATFDRDVSDSGRYVVFESDQDASLAPGHARRLRSVFLRDTATNTTVDVCVSTAGKPANDGCSQPAVSGDGRSVAFVSQATNLDPADADPSPSVYVRNLQAGTTVLASRADGAGGASATEYTASPSLSADGTRVAFQTQSVLAAPDSGSDQDVYVRDLTAGTTALISRKGATEADGDSTHPDISGNGQWVAFESYATNLDPLDPNTRSDVYRAPAAGGTPVLMSRSAADQVGDKDSYQPSISADGGAVAFGTNATNLVPGDANGKQDVIVRTVGGQVTLASRADGAAGAQGDADTWAGALSGDGQHVAFSTDAANFGAVPGRQYGGLVFVRNLVTGTTRLASRGNGAAGAPAGSAGGPSVDADGGVVTFGGNGIGQDAGPHDDRLTQIYARNMAAGTTRHVSRPSGTAAYSGGVAGAYSDRQAMSRDGRYVVFTSASSGLAALPAGERPGCDHVYRRDMVTGAVALVDRASGGAVANGCAGGSSVSADGRYAAFVSEASNLDPAVPQSSYQVYVRDMSTGAVVLGSRATGAGGAKITQMGEDDFALSADGRHLVFGAKDKLDPADTNGDYDVYERDLTAKTTVLVSRANGTAGAGGDAASYRGAPSADGSVVVFTTKAADLGDGDVDSGYDVHVRNLQTGTTTLVSRANGAAGAKANADTFSGSLSADGTRVAFFSRATNLGDGDGDTQEDIHVRDLHAGTTVWASRGAGGVQANAEPDAQTLSPDGRTVLFSSRATNLVAGDTNGFRDVFAHDLSSGVTKLVSAGVGGAAANDDTWFGDVSANGSCLLLRSNATNLVAGGYSSPDFRHVYLRAIGGACAVAPPPPPSDTTAPVLSQLRLTPAAIRVGSAPTAVAAAAKAAPKKTFIAFRSTEAGTATITIARASTGRRVGTGAKRRCAKPTKANRRKPRCTRYRTAGTLTRKAVHGNTKVTFTGRIGTKALKPGTYRVSVTVKDASGNRSAAKSAALKIVRG